MVGLENTKLEDLFINTQTQETDNIGEAVKSMTDKKKASVLTELSDKDIGLIIRFKEISLMTKIKLFDSIAERFLELRISKKRQSRKEITEVLKSQLVNEAQNARKAQDMKNLLGLG